MQIVRPFSRFLFASKHIEKKINALQNSFAINYISLSLKKFIGFKDALPIYAKEYSDEIVAK